MYWDKFTSHKGKTTIKNWIKLLRVVEFYCYLLHLLCFIYSVTFTCYNYSASYKFTYLFLLAMPGVLLIGDSILRHVHHDRLDVVCRPGATIERLIKELHQKIREYNKYPFIIIHVGTNDLQKGSHHFMDKFEELALFMRVNYPHSQIFFSSILPRPKDHGKYLSDVAQFANSYISECVHHYDAGEVIFTHKAFLQAGNPITDLYSRDGLHINTGPGVQKFTSSIVSYLGQWCRKHNTNIPQHQLQTN